MVLLLVMMVVVAARIRNNGVRDARIKAGRRARLTHRSVGYGASVLAQLILLIL